MWGIANSSKKNSTKALQLTQPPLQRNVRPQGNSKKVV